MEFDRFSSDAANRISVFADAEDRARKPCRDLPVKGHRLTVQVHTFDFGGKFLTAENVFRQYSAGFIPVQNHALHAVFRLFPVGKQQFGAVRKQDFHRCFIHGAMQGFDFFNGGHAVCPGFKDGGENRFQRRLAFPAAVEECYMLLGVLLGAGRFAVCQKTGFIRPGKGVNTQIRSLDRLKTFAGFCRESDDCCRFGFQSPHIGEVLEAAPAVGRIFLVAVPHFRIVIKVAVRYIFPGKRAIAGRGGDIGNNIFGGTVDHPVMPGTAADTEEIQHHQFSRHRFAGQQRPFIKAHMPVDPWHIGLHTLDFFAEIAMEQGTGGAELLHFSIHRHRIVADGVEIKGKAFRIIQRSGIRITEVRHHRDIAGKNFHVQTVPVLVIRVSPEAEPYRCFFAGTGVLQTDRAVTGQQRTLAAPEGIFAIFLRRQGRLIAPHGAGIPAGRGEFSADPQFILVPENAFRKGVSFFLIHAAFQEGFKHLIQVIEPVTVILGGFGRGAVAEKVAVNRVIQRRGEPADRLAEIRDPPDHGGVFQYFRDPQKCHLMHSEVSPVPAVFSHNIISHDAEHIVFNIPHDLFAGFAGNFFHFCIALFQKGFYGKIGRGEFAGNAGFPDGVQDAAVVIRPLFAGTGLFAVLIPVIKICIPVQS